MPLLDNKHHRVKDLYSGDFPGGSVVKTLCFHCRGHGFDPWWGDLNMLCGTAKKIFLILLVYSKHKELHPPQINHNRQTLFSWASKSLQTVTAAMKLKDACSLEEKL